MRVKPRLRRMCYKKRQFISARTGPIANLQLGLTLNRLLLIGHSIFEIPKSIMTEDEYNDRKIVSAETVEPVAEALPKGPQLVFEHWLSLKESDIGPHYSKFYIDDLPIRMIPASMVYDVIDGGRDYRYRFFGSDRVKSHGEDYTDRFVSNMTPHLMALKIAAENTEVVKTKQPVVINTVAAVGGEEFQYSLMRLPLFDDTGDVARIYGLPFNGTGPELPERQWGHWFGRHAKDNKI